MEINEEIDENLGIMDHCYAIARLIHNGHIDPVRYMGFDIKVLPILVRALDDLITRCELDDSFRFSPELDQAHAAIAIARGES